LAATNSTIASSATLTAGDRWYGHDQEIMWVPFFERNIEFAACEKIGHGKVLTTQAHQ
jgi:hypothetical protein